MRILGTTASHFSESTPVVSGGTITTDATFVYRSFTSSGTLTISGSALSATVYAIGGGGGGQASYLTFGINSGGDNVDVYLGGAGGGAGQTIIGSATTIPVAANSITIGAGAPGRVAGGSNFTGGATYVSYPGVTFAVFAAGGTSDSGNGGNSSFSGGIGYDDDGYPFVIANGGGGGGAGGAGGNATSTVGGARGVSLSVPDLTTPGYSVLGSGGRGHSQYYSASGSSPGTSGIRGNGGNAGVNNTSGDAGTAGLVVVRYLRSLTGE